MFETVKLNAKVSPVPMPESRSRPPLAVMTLARQLAYLPARICNLTTGLTDWTRTPVSIQCASKGAPRALGQGA